MDEGPHHITIYASDMDKIPFRTSGHNRERRTDSIGPDHRISFAGAGSQIDTFPVSAGHIRAG